jgi:hypothetical protein
MLNSSKKCNTFASEDFQPCWLFKIFLQGKKCCLSTQEFHVSPYYFFYSPRHFLLLPNRSMGIQAINPFQKQKKHYFGLFTRTITKLFIAAAALMVKKSLTTMDMSLTETTKGLTGSNGSMWFPPKHLGTVFHPGVMGMKDALPGKGNRSKAGIAPEK